MEYGIASLWNATEKKWEYLVQSKTWAAEPDVTTLFRSFSVREASDWLDLRTA